MHACIYMTLPGWLLAARLSGCLLVSLVHASYSLCSHRSALLCGCVQVIKVDRITGDQEFKKNMVYLSFICETTRIVTEKIPTTKVSTCTSSAPVSKVSETFGGLIPEGFLDAPGSSSSFVPPFAHAIFKASVGSTHRTDHVLQAQNFSRGSASTDHHGLQHQQQSLGRSSTSTGVEEGRFSVGSFTSDERSINNSAGDSRGTRKLEPAVPRSRQPAAPLLSQEFTGDDEEGNFDGNWEESNIDAEPEEEPETAASKALKRDLESIMPPPKRRSSVASSSSSASWAFFKGQGAASKGAADITPEDPEEDTSKAFNNGRNKPAAGRVTRGAGKGGRGARGGRAR